MTSGVEMRVNLHQLLKAMIEKGASDMHITTGSPPLLRIDGSIVPLKLSPLGPVDTKQLCFSKYARCSSESTEKQSCLVSIGPSGGRRRGMMLPSMRRRGGVPVVMWRSLAPFSIIVRRS